MRKLILTAPGTLALLAALTVSGVSAERTSSLEPLQGKWSTTRTNREGETYAQFIEIRKDQLTFEVRDRENQIRIYAKGTIRAEQQGPFQVLTVSDIQGGRSPTELEPVNDSRAMVYALRDDKLMIASNFDRERERETPRVDTYLRGEHAVATGSAAKEGAEPLLGQWKMEAQYGDQTLEYSLRFERAEGQVKATLISPRSGEHPFKSVSLKQGNLVMEIDREIEGNSTTLIYAGKLTGEGMSGTVKIKGNEDAFTGRWKAWK